MTKTAASIGGLILFGLAWAVTASPVMGNTEHKTEQLRRIMAQITVRTSQIAQRQADAAALREALALKLAGIQTEVWHEFHATEIKTESDLFERPKLWYSLMLMAEIESYRNRYREKIDDYRLICDRLDYLYQQAADDLKMVATLPGVTVDARAAQADEILEAAFVDAQSILIDPGRLHTDPPATIWKNLLQSRK